jgi:hypothetical protein
MEPQFHCPAVSSTRLKKRIVSYLKKMRVLIQIMAIIAIIYFRILNIAIIFPPNRNTNNLLSVAILL